MSRNKCKTIFAPAFKCECCGRIMVLLRGRDWTPEKRYFLVRCYAKGWDGNPWYVPGVHLRHPGPKRYVPKEDPFFTLD